VARIIAEVRVFIAGSFGQNGMFKVATAWVSSAWTTTARGSADAAATGSDVLVISPATAIAAVRTAA
jgi:hypothetical protein